MKPIGYLKYDGGSTILFVDAATLNAIPYVLPAQAEDWLSSTFATSKDCLGFVRTSEGIAFMYIDEAGDERVFSAIKAALTESERQDFSDKFIEICKTMSDRHV